MNGRDGVEFVVRLGFAHLRVVGFEWWVFPELGVGVLVVDVIADANKLLSSVCAGDQDHGDSYSVALGDQACVRSVRLLHKHTLFLFLTFFDVPKSKRYISHHSE